MKCGVRRDTWVPPYITLFCRAGPACPAVGARKESPSHGFAVTAPFRQGGRGLRIATTSLRTGLAMTPFQEVRWVSLWCVGEGLCPSRGRGNRRSAADGRRSEAVSRKCPDWRPQQWPGIGWHEGGQENPAPTECSEKCGGAGRCGERTERCRWQRKRSERVAAVKISSVRRKAAWKFWAPQQDHRPLRSWL